MSKVVRKTRKELFWTIKFQKDGFRFIYECNEESVKKKDRLAVVYSKYLFDRADNQSTGQTCFDVFVEYSVDEQ